MNEKNTATLEIYIVRYRKGTGSINDLYYQAESAVHAKQAATDFCNKHGFQFVYCKPFLTDLNTHPAI